MTPPPPSQLVAVAVYSGAHREARRQRDAAIAEALHHGIRHDDVAAAAGLSPAAVRKIRNDHRETPIETLLRDCREFIAEIEADGTTWNFVDLAEELAQWIPQWAEDIEGERIKPIEDEQQK